MKRLALLLLLLLLPTAAAGESLEQGVQEVLRSLDLSALEEAAREGAWGSLNVGDALMCLASGQAALSAQEVLNTLLTQVSGVFGKSVWRMTRLMIPALIAACAEWLRPETHAAGKAARYAGALMTMAFLVTDLREHTQLCMETVESMADWMQRLFPVLITLLAAVGGTASSAFYQPAMMAAAGSMTTLVRHVAMPLTTGMAMLTMVGGLSENLRVSRLCRLLRQAACWTLGFGFTVFIGVMTVQGVSAASVDGISIRTAKYALDNFIPIVGGMFADTVDTLVGCSLVVHNAVGVLGLLMLLGMLMTPLLRTVMTLLLYRASAALLQPVADGPLCRAIGGYGDVFTLLFTIELSVGAMFLVLVAQVIAVGSWTVMLR